MLTAYYYVLGNSVPYDLGNLFNDIRGETSACAQDGPPTFPKRTRVSVLCKVYLSHAYAWDNNVHTRYRLLVLHFQYTVVFMNGNLELKSLYVLSLIRMPQGQHVLVSSKNEPSNMVKKELHQIIVNFPNVCTHE